MEGRNSMIVDSTVPSSNKEVASSPALPKYTFIRTLNCYITSIFLIQLLLHLNVLSPQSQSSQHTLVSSRPFFPIPPHCSHLLSSLLSSPPCPHLLSSLLSSPPCSHLLSFLPSSPPFSPLLSSLLPSPPCAPLLSSLLSSPPCSHLLSSLPPSLPCPHVLPSLPPSPPCPHLLSLPNKRSPVAPLFYFSPIKTSLFHISLFN